MPRRATSTRRKRYARGCVWFGLILACTQRVSFLQALAEITEMIHVASILHGEVVNVSTPDIQMSETDVFGNKVSVVYHVLSGTCAVLSNTRTLTLKRCTAMPSILS